MFVFGSDKKARGCFFSFSAGGKDILSPRIRLQTGETESLPKAKDKFDPMIVTGVSFSQKEKFHVVQCFNDVNHTYAFGHDPMASMISVQFIVFLVGSKGKGGAFSNGVNRMLKAYRTGRLSQNQKYIELFFGNQVLKGFLVSMSSSTSDAHHNLQAFTMDLICPEVHK